MNRQNFVAHGLTIDPNHDRQIAGIKEKKAFELPKGWVIEVRPRGPFSATKQYDKYYRELNTGKVFRSIVSMKRYLNQEEEISQSKLTKRKINYQSSGNTISKQVKFNSNLVHGKQVVSSATQHKVPSSGWIVKKVSCKDGVPNDRISKRLELESNLVHKGKQVVSSATRHKVSSSLPDGWIVKEVPRKNGLRCDRYYIDPVTKFRFRSLPEVKRYLSNEVYLYKKKNAPEVINPSSIPPKGFSSSGKKIVLSNETLDRSRKMLDIFHPPERGSWILNRLKEEEKWSPLVDESKIPDHVKELWQETFLFGMNTGSGSDKLRPNIPQLTIGAAKSP